MRAEKAVTIDEKSSPKVLTAAVAIAVSMLLSTGFTMMMSTALGTGISTKRLVFSSFILALVFTAVFFFDKIWVSFGVLISMPVAFTLAAVFDWFNVQKGLFALLHFIKLYVFLWFPGDYPEDPEGAKNILIFIIAYNLIALSVTCFVLMKRKCIPVCLLFYLPMFICAVSNTDISPKAAYCLIAGAGLIMVLLCNAFRKKRQSTYERVIIVLMVPVFAFMFLLGGIFPQKNYNKDKLATNILLELRYRAEKIAGRDNLFWEIINRALNGFENIDFDDSFDSVSPLYSAPTDLSRVGPFNPSDTEVLKIYRKTNPAYSGSVPVYAGNVLYLKIESKDKYANNKLTSTKIPGKVYDTKINPPEEPAMYSVEVSPLRSATVDIVPYYSDYYLMDDTKPTKFNPYNSTRQYVFKYASANTPVKTGNIYSKTYLENYVYKTCLEVPYRTDRVLITSGQLPDWYLDVYYNRVQMSDAEKVERVTEYVRGLHPYDTNTAYPPAGEDFVPWFVLKGETGICVHYAATSMILLRMIGIPTRYVRGYVDTNSVLDGESSVYAYQAHAWFEFFVPEYGWVIGDATPGYKPEQDYFNLNAISRVHPEVTGVQFSKGAETQGNQGGTETETEQSEQTTATSETTTEAAESDPSASRNDPSETTFVPPGGKPGESGSSSLVDDDDGGELWKEQLVNFFRLLGTVVIVLAALAFVVFAARVAFVLYWLNRFHTEKINDKAVSYYHYFTLMTRVFKFVFPAAVREIAEKATFSGRDISKKELDLLRVTCMKTMKITSGDFTGPKKLLFRLMVIPDVKGKAEDKGVRSPAGPA